MTFTTREIEVIASIMQEKGVNRNCTACANGEMKILPEGAFIVQANDRKKANYDVGMTTVTFLCPNCGHVRNHICSFLGIEF